MIDSFAVRDHAAGTTPVTTLEGDDLFTLGRRACQTRDAALGRRASFVRTRQLLRIAAGAGGGSAPAVEWRGPRDAAESYVDERDLESLGGWQAAASAGAELLVGGRSPELHRAAVAGGMRSLWRLPFSAGEDPSARRERVETLRRLVAGGLHLWGVMPTPEGEPHGLDAVRLFALCRLVLPADTHLVADVTQLGPRLAQMCLGFGADELFAPIVAERALRLGANARNPAMTRKEAATLIRGAGLVPCERLAGQVIEEVNTP